MKIVFIVPKDNDQHSPLSQFAQCRILPPVSLAKMAGLVGKQSGVSLVDERIASAHHEQHYDIAIIFINSYNRQRAYAIAKHYDNNGSLVVFTGPMLSQSPEDAAEHADCLFIGYGEDCMPEFVADYRLGKLKSFYHGASSKKPVNTHSKPIYGNTALRFG